MAIRFPSHVLPEFSSMRHLGTPIHRPTGARPCASSSSVDKFGGRVFVLSDLHTDYSDNLKWVQSLSTCSYRDDVILVAGDVAETYRNFCSTMSLLKERFRYVFYVPGNHDLWCRREAEDLDSLEKLNRLLDACARLGVETSPMCVNGLGIVPLFSWYHESFDREKDINGINFPPLEMVIHFLLYFPFSKLILGDGELTVEFPEPDLLQTVAFVTCVGILRVHCDGLKLACKDFHACKWPDRLSTRDTSLALYFDAINEKYQSRTAEIQSTCSQIISFSHFVPRQELCPEKRMLFYPKLPKIIGSDWLEARIRSIHGADGTSSGCHVFGHTHFCWDSILDGVRYIQAPLAYPRERKKGMNGGEEWLPFCIYYDGRFAERCSPCPWSNYYDANPRMPDNTQLAPWVARYYKRSS